MAFKILNEQQGPDLKLFESVFQKVEKEETGEKSDVLILKSNDAVNMIPIDEDNKVILVNQYRFGIQDYTLEIPGGFIEENETPLQAAKRELLEETGYIAPEWKYLGKSPSNPVFQNAYIHHFIALNASLKSKPNPDPAEKIEAVRISKPDVLMKLKSGGLQHPHTIAAFMLAYDILF